MLKVTYTNGPGELQAGKLSVSAIFYGPVNGAVRADSVTLAAVESVTTATSKQTVNNATVDFLPFKHIVSKHPAESRTT